MAQLKYKWQKSPIGWICAGCGDLGKHCGESLYGQVALISGANAYCVKCAEKAGLGAPDILSDIYITQVSTTEDDLAEYFDVPEAGYVGKWGGPKDVGCSCYIAEPDGEVCDKIVNKNTGLYLYKTYSSTGKKVFSGFAWAAECAAARGYERDTGKSKVCMGCDIEICNVCAVCHTADCVFIERKVTTAIAKAKYSYLLAKTQKARGYVTLAESSLRVPKPFRIISSEADIDETVRAMNGRSGFIRPCPMRPRHGFVDSRPITVSVESRQEISDLLKTAIAADEQGHAELLLVPFIDSAYNAIVTPNRIAVGPGHDGATSGKNSKSFPLVGIPFKEITPEVLASARIGGNEDAYIEAVVQPSRLVYFTQIRAGVKIPPTVGADFVPYPVRVTEVIEASGDLLEWEQQVKSIKRGTVVFHLGGTLISHYGVHCMQNDIPVFTSRRPNIGEVLDVVSKVDKPDPQAVIRGLGAGAYIPLDINGKSLGSQELFIQNGLITMMTVLHNSAAMSGDDGFWLGVAVAMMYRAGMAASHGEARHKLQGYAGSRETIYRLALKNFFDGRNTLGHAQWKFINNSWSSGYGGKAWAKCTDSIIQMDNVIRKLYTEPTTENVAALVNALNVAVNQAHNGGWWLNKFITHGYFDKAASQSLETVVVSGATMYEILRLLDGKESSAQLMIEDWGTSPEIVVKNGQLQCQEQPMKKKEVKATPPVPETTAGSPSVWHGLCVPYGSNKIPENPQYVGVFCEICGKMFPELCREDLESGQTCGETLVESGESNTCLGLTGWYQNGLFAYPISSDIPDHDVEGPDEDPDPIEEDYNDDPFEDDPPEPEKFDSEDNDTPGMIVPVKAAPASTNFNSVSVPATAKVIYAQCNFHKGFSWVHVQYKLDVLGGYKSCDINGVIFPSEVKVTMPSLLKHPSLSGSPKGYAKMEIKQWEGLEGSWKLYIPEVKLLLGLNIIHNTLSELEWEEQLNEQTPQTEETKAGEASDSSPF